MPITVFTIGHGERALAQFLTMLEEVQIEALVDVRAWPQSRRFPHFGSEQLRAALEETGVVYHWAGRHLGGKREPRPRSRHTALTDEGLRGYADHMETDAFQRAAIQLTRLAGASRTAVMCAERDAARCHRWLLADYLTLKGVQVVHLLDPERRCEHVPSSSLRRETDQAVYDRHCSGRLELE